jgi:hypothetical protein
MTGTSSDCAFADAYTSGVITDMDTALNIFNSGYKDAYIVPDYQDKYGRKGLIDYENEGYVSMDKIDESFS